MKLRRDKHAVNEKKKSIRNEEKIEGSRQDCLFERRMPMSDYMEDNFYYLEMVRMKGEYHVILYKAWMGLWEAREAFLDGLQEGMINRQLVLGVEKDGEKIPFFQCDDGKFYIPEIKSRDMLGKPADTLLEELSGRFGIEECGEKQVVYISDTKEQDYDIRITETLSKIVTVRAQSMESSLSEAHDNYSDAKSGYVLDYSDLRGVTLSMVGIHREKPRNMGGR